MKWNPRECAKDLVALKGKVKAKEIAEMKLFDAPFLVNGNSKFWREVIKQIGGMR